jgi:hypothetical protein
MTIGREIDDRAQVRPRREQWDLMLIVKPESLSETRKEKKSKQTNSNFTKNISFQ